MCPGAQSAHNLPSYELCVIPHKLCVTPHVCMQFYREKLKASVEGRDYTPPPPSEVGPPTLAATARPTTSQRASAPRQKDDEWGDWGGSGSTGSVRAILLGTVHIPGTCYLMSIKPCDVKMQIDLSSYMQMSCMYIEGAGSQLVQELTHHAHRLSQGRRHGSADANCFAGWPL
jgi:hypothetical protein